MSEEKPSNAEARFTWRGLLRNPISLGGIALALVGLANVAIFVIIGAVANNPSPYVGILAYMVSPAFFVLGLLLMLLGLLLDRRKKSPTTIELKIDLRDPSQRGALISFVAFLVVFALASAVGSYKAYEYTESVRFCGQVCHSENPEFTTHQLSAHARVACVDCHIGSGATWYVKYKLSGMRQLFAETLNTFPRPIPTPVHDLRPAQQTCEQCHWPEKFYGGQLKVLTHYSSDEQNTVRQIRMVIKTGGGDPATGAATGIHWHMNIGNKIDYVAADDKRQVIPYIRVEDRHGRVTEYYAKDSKLSKDQIAKSIRRRMDCVDCHNRPTHIYASPDRAVDESLAASHLDPSLPFIKQQAVAVLTATYPTTDAATRTIADGLHKFYESKYPDLAKAKQVEISNAVADVQQIYRNTTFPEMKVSWETHPDNLGHYYFMGCFRCHDGQHMSSDGKVISKDCNQCHTVLSQTEGANTVARAASLSFQHPVDLGDLTQVNCSDCHTGGTSP